MHPTKHILNACLILFSVLLFDGCRADTDEITVPTLAVLPSLTPSQVALASHQVFTVAPVTTLVPDASEPTVMPPIATAAPLATLVPPTRQATTWEAVPRNPESQVQRGLDFTVSVPQSPVANQLIIHFTPDSTEQQRAAYLQQLGGTIVHEFEATNSAVVSLQPQLSPVQANPSSPVVESTEPDYYIAALGFIPNDPLADDQWSLPVIGAPDAWTQLTASTRTVTVALIDSGICADHEDLVGQITDGYDFVEDDAVPQDGFGHGCAVAGIIAARLNNGLGIAGVAPNVRLMPLRVLDGNGIGQYSHVAEAIIYAVDHGAEIINLSLGGAYTSQVLEDAVNYAASHGVLMIGAVGNAGQDTAFYPAAYAPVIAVGSVDVDGSASAFSNRTVDIWSPGQNILTTSLDNHYAAYSGTSMAAAEVSGIAALELALLDQRLAPNGGVIHFDSGSDVPPTPSLNPTDLPDESRIDPEVRDTLVQSGEAQVIISLYDPVSIQADNLVREQAIAQAQDTVLAQLASTDFALERRYTFIPALSGIITANSVSALESNPQIVSVALDELITAQGNGAQELGVVDLHGDGSTGTGINVAIIDTGVNPDSPTFSGIDDAIIEEQCFTHYACAPNNDIQGTSALTSNNHGTVVADIITGAGGYAPASRIIPVRVLDNNGSGYLSDWLAGLDWVRANGQRLGIRIVNMSLGTSDTFTGSCDSTGDLIYDSAHNIIDQIVSRGIAVFASTGNRGLDAVAFPACLSNVIAVGATYASDYGQQPPSGTYDDLDPSWPNCSDLTTDIDSVACFSNHGSETDIFAPGVHSTTSSYIYGTSFASPAAAGVAALMLQENPNLTPSEIRGNLRDTASIATLGANTYLRMNPPAAVQAIKFPDANCDYEVVAGSISGLKNAIIAANNAGTVYTICLEAGATYTPGQPYTPPSSLPTENAFPVITGDVIIEGRGAVIQRNSTAPQFRFFQLAETGPGLSPSLIINNLSLVGGSVEGRGGAIYSQYAPVTLNYVVLSGNQSPEGGAVYGAHLEINDSRFDGNGDTFGTNGGAVFINTFDSTSTINRSVFTNNFSGQGGAVFSESFVTISNSVFYANSGSGGGAIYGNVAINNSTFANNHAQNQGGAFAIDQNLATPVIISTSEFTNNSAEVGGALSLQQSTILSQSRFETNSAGGGGAIYVNTGSLEVSESSFIGNYAVGGGGAIIVVTSSGNYLIDRSTFAGNRADLHSAAIGTSGNMSIINSTFVGNIAPTDGGTLNTDISGDTEIAHSTFFNNGPNTLVSAGTTEVKNSIIDGGADAESNCSVSGTLLTFGVNFSTDGTCSGFTQVTTQELALGPYTVQGAAPGFLPLLVNSIAIDTVPSGECSDIDNNVVTTDTRGAARPIGSACDVGAVENESDLAPTDDFAEAPLLESLSSYSYTGDRAGTAEVGEPVDCIPPELVADGQSQHLALTGTSLRRNFTSGRSLRRSFSSGSMYYLIDATQSSYDAVIGVYIGDNLGNLSANVVCSETDANGNGQILLQIPSTAIDDGTEYRVIVWNKDQNGVNLVLTIEDAAFADCNDVSEIPREECDALVAFYNLTNGLNWTLQPPDAFKGWLDTNLPCTTWYGIVCTNDHITGINLTVDDNNLALPPNTSAFGYFQSLINLGNANPGDIIVNTSEMTVADDGFCSLVEAILAANTSLPSGASDGECVPTTDAPDTIRLTGGSIYTLTQIYENNDGANGLPNISQDLTIIGEGATIERTRDDDAPSFRIFHVDSNCALILQGLRLQNGREHNGAAIYIHSGSLRLENVTITNNLAFEFGGGVFTDHLSPITLINSEFRDNAARRSGGAFFVGAGNVEIHNSTIRDNFARESGGGFFVGGLLTMSGSTVSGNFGGAIIADDGGTIRNSTISGNTSPFSSNGVVVTNDLLSITYSTIAYNVGSNILDEPVPNVISLGRTILSHNVGWACPQTVDSRGYNISDDSSCTLSLQSNGDQPEIDAGLLPLENNGGPTQTHALSVNSPAIDAAPFQRTVASDQRGMARPEGANSDIGAFETPYVLPPSNTDAVPSLNFYTTHTPTLTWNRITWAVQYQIQVDNNADFSSPEFQRSNVSSNALSVVTTYLTSRSYYVRVRAKHSDGTWGAWSPVDSFTIVAG